MHKIKNKAQIFLINLYFIKTLIINALALFELIIAFLIFFGFKTNPCAS